MMVPNQPNLTQHGSAIQNRVGVPNPFGNVGNGIRNENELDPKVKEIQDLVTYWENSTDN